MTAATGTAQLRMAGRLCGISSQQSEPGQQLQVAAPGLTTRLRNCVCWIVLRMSGLTAVAGGELRSCVAGLGASSGKWEN